VASLLHTSMSSCLLYRTTNSRFSKFREWRAAKHLKKKRRVKVHPKTLFEMWITCLERVSANSEKGRGSEWAVRVGQRLQSRFGQSGAVRELNLVQIVEEVSAIRGGLPST